MPVKWYQCLDVEFQTHIEKERKSGTLAWLKAVVKKNNVIVSTKTTLPWLTKYFQLFLISKNGEGWIAEDAKNLPSRSSNCSILTPTTINRHPTMEYSMFWSTYLNNRWNQSIGMKKWMKDDVITGHYYTSPGLILLPKYRTISSSWFHMSACTYYIWTQGSIQIAWSSTNYCCCAANLIFLLPGMYVVASVPNLCFLFCSLILSA